MRSRVKFRVKGKVKVKGKIKVKGKVEGKVKGKVKGCVYVLYSLRAYRVSLSKAAILLAICYISCKANTRS